MTPLDPRTLHVGPDGGMDAGKEGCRDGWRRAAGLSWCLGQLCLLMRVNRGALDLLV